jgi:hypothetical protein
MCGGDSRTTKEIDYASRIQENHILRNDDAASDRDYGTQNHKGFPLKS